MRILYLGISDDLGHCAGVGKKLRGQIRHLRRAGAEVEGSLFHLAETGSDAAPPDCSPEVEFVPVRCPANGSRLYQMQKRKAYFQAIEQVIQKSSWDMIYFRYPFSDPTLLRFVRRFHGRVVFEHQTIEPAEIRLRGGKGMSYWSETLFAPLVFRSAGGSVGVTRQITEFEKRRAGQSYPAITISNGIEVDSVARRNPPPYTGQVLDLLMVATFNPWHGLDRVLEGLGQYRGEIPIHLHVVGEGVVLEDACTRVGSLGLEDFVTFYGKLTGKDLDRMFDRCHLGISTLALHRKGMIEASTLKVRDYWARGIPIVLSERDTDLHECEAMKPFYRQVAMNDAPLDMSEIVAFAQRVLALPNYRQQMVDLSRVTIDMICKMKKLKAFFETITR